MMPGRVWTALAFCVAVARSQSISSVIGQQPELSTYLTLFNQSAAAQQILSQGNCTIFAPTNAAFTDANLNISTLDPDDRDAFLLYHVLQGNHSSSSLKAQAPAFLHTQLTSTNQSWITGGQVVEISNANDTLQVISAVWTPSTVIKTDLSLSSCVLHTVGTAFIIPIAIALTLIPADLTGFQNFGNALSFLSPQFQPYVQSVQYQHDVTAFLPNITVAQASQYTNLSSTEALQLFNYHVVLGFDGYSTRLTDRMQLQTLAGVNLTVYHVNGSIYINNARMFHPDLIVKNGVAQVLDKVLDPRDPTAHPPGVTLTNTTASATAVADANNGLSAGAKTGLGIGVALGAALIAAALAAVFILRRRRRPQAQQSDSHELGGEDKPRHEADGDGTRQEMSPDGQRLEMPGDEKTLLRHEMPGDFTAQELMADEAIRQEQKRKSLLQVHELA